ncbi:MAG: 3-oxoisoapionate kinase [Bryobacterales bacterium]|jgi:uncharacterized protein YgbK (DUF1537 family)|nr:3-oxoisoapionate kinase [Bryobacterales bacterium]
MTDRLLTFYGDDFTGSTDALEAVASHGIPSVLFLNPPDEDLLAQFSECRAIGIAGESRSRGPGWMDAQLPPVFEALKRIGAPICQYKVCSTFDSAPETGSIGRAMEIGQRVFRNPWVPIAVAAPHLKRYVVFGNLFALAAGTVYRIDQHPTMSRHPVTPMDEADLRRHLALQTHGRIELVDIVALESGNAEALLEKVLAASPAAVLFDGLLQDTIQETGRLIWSKRSEEPMFCVGSSGLTHALMLHWREIGLIPRTHTPPVVNKIDRLIVISGSCAAATELQLRWAMRNGYTGIRVDAGTHPFSGVVSEALNALKEGRNIAIYSALGPGDCIGIPHGETLGRYLGSLLLELVRQSGVRRAVIAGGDTSSHAVRQLGIQALTFAGLLSPGAPLCRAHSGESAIDGLELVLKGGQVGPENFFEMVQKGTS